ncbi:hypothetical protein ASC99_33910 [Kitasatospora sp. Root107]|nr:hypothetical protein ASC99_33910 [Kitasatospora sp. Root107]
MGPVVDLAPVDGPGAVWLALCEDGRIVRWSLETGRWSAPARTGVTVPEGVEPWDGHEQRRRLHASVDGRFAAVVLDYGLHGEVFDLRTGARRLVLHGDDDDTETVPFSLAFAEHRGRTVLVHRTLSYRLDVSDPASGQLLTARETGPGSEHDLDYYHGALHVGPDGRFLVDDGWIWHPVGSVTAWSLHDWLDGNPYESEGGPSWVVLADCDHYWDRPIAWLDGRRVAIGGLGDRRERIVPGVTVLDVTGRSVTPYGSEQAARVVEFAGPAGQLFADRGLLYSAGGPGLQVWDPSDGSLLGTVPGFHPTHHHRAAGELVRLEGGALLRWSAGGGASRR